MQMQRKKTFTMNWDGLCDDDNEDRFFLESSARVLSNAQSDLANSSDDEDYEDSRMSFTSVASSIRSDEFNKPFGAASPLMFPDYDVWMASPGCIKERRKRLLQGMGLIGEKETVRLASKQIERAVSKKVENVVVEVKDSETEIIDNRRSIATESSPHEEVKEIGPSHTPLRIVLVRSRSEGDIDELSHEKRTKEELIGKISKQQLTRTYSAILPHCGPVGLYTDPVRISPNENCSQAVKHSNSLMPVLSNRRFGAFVLIKNLDTGKEFIVNESDPDGMWNRLSDLQTGKQLTMEEFEKSVGYSPVVKELMRRENTSRSEDHGSERKTNSYSFSKSLRISKRRGAALLKNIKGSMRELIGDREGHPSLDQKSGPNSVSPPSEWVKVRQTGKTCKDLSALHLCQEIDAHEGSIWTIKFNCDARYLASAGEDRVIHVWEVQECEVTSMKPNEEGSVTTNHHSPDQTSSIDVNPDKKKKGKGLGSRKGNAIPDYVHVPENVFSLSEKPVCSFKGHLDDVLDLSWSRTQLLLSSSMDKTVRLWDLESKNCLKMFAHNDYVTCIQFNPVDDDYFISGSLDAKVRIWSIPERQVVDWTDPHEMVTATCFYPDGQGALIGSHKGSCRMYNTEDCKLDQANQINSLTKKKSQAKKITGFQFNPGNSSEVLVTSADSRIRILDGSDIVHKFTGFKNTSSQIAASFSQDGQYVICASEDSQVYVWKREEAKNQYSGKPKTKINSRGYEHFHCRDVSAAIPWTGTVNGEPPLNQINSKRNSKRSSIHHQPSTINEDSTTSSAANSKRFLPPLPKKNNNNTSLESHQNYSEEDNPTRITRTESSGIGESFNSSNSSPTRDDDDSNNNKKNTPSLPKKNNNGGSESHLNPGEEEVLAQVSRTESGGIGESFSSGSALIRHGDSSSASISSAANPSSASWSSSWSWLDGGGNHGGSNSAQTVGAWGLVIVTAGLGGEIRVYQNFGLPRRIGRQTNFWPTS